MRADTRRALWLRVRQRAGVESGRVTQPS
jgi:hypothetical protein